MCKRKPNIAVFIDAENISSSWLDRVYSSLGRLGVISFSKAYGNWASVNSGGWKEAFQRHSIQPVQMYAMLKGKNAADMGLVVDAMEALYSLPVDIFCIISSDCDFTPLAMRLREKGKLVLGIGRENAVDAYKNACSKFLSISPEAKLPSGKALPARNYHELEPSVLAAISGCADVGGGWRWLSTVGEYLGKHSPVNPKDYGDAKLAQVLRKCAFLQVRRVGVHYQVKPN